MSNVSEHMRERNVPQNVHNYLYIKNICEPLFEYAVIAGGGAISLYDKNIPCGDFDFYPKYSETEIDYYYKVSEFIKKMEYIFKDSEYSLKDRVSITSNAITWTINRYGMNHNSFKIQLILINDKIEDILESFDIEACKLWYNGDVIYGENKSLADVCKLTIEIDFRKNNCVYDYRLKKYHNKGFNIYSKEPIDWEKTPTHKEGLGYLLDDRDVLKYGSNYRLECDWMTYAYLSDDTILVLSAVAIQKGYNKKAIDLTDTSRKFMTDNQKNDWFAGMLKHDDSSEEFVKVPKTIQFDLSKTSFEFDHESNLLTVTTLD